MKLPIYHINAFAEQTFEGNPAAVVPLDEWLPESTMQLIAEENNLSETAFFVPIENGFSIRWFTPNTEVRLCGHATLASAYVLFNILGFDHDVITFDSLSGELSVSKNDDLLTLDFPTQNPAACETPIELTNGLGAIPNECLSHDDYIAVFDNEKDILDITPDHESLKLLDLRGVIVTAPSTTYDFVARFFAPNFGIPEDPVTGSAFTQLMPYWVNKLGKTKLNAKQVSSRGGKLICELKGDRVLISGGAVKYMEGNIEI